MQLIFNLFRNVASTGKEIHLYLKYHISTYLLSKARQYNFRKYNFTLIKLGADVDVKDDIGNTLLHEAVIEKDLDAISVLMSYGANPDITNFNGKTPWFIVYQDFNPELEENIDLRIIGTLLRLKTDNHAQLATRAILRHAKKHHSFVHLEKFIELGANINQPDKDGNTLLHFAAKNDNLYAAKLIIKKNPNISNRNKYGEMPIHLAAKSHSIGGESKGGVLLLLLNKGAYPNAESSSGETPLHIALHNPHETVKETLDILIENDADLAIDNNKQQTLLHTAVIAKNTTALNHLLIHYNIDINSKDHRGSTPLHLAMYHMSGIEIVTYLFFDGANIAAIDDFGNIPLHYLMKTSPRERIFKLSEEQLEEQKNIFTAFYNKDKKQVTARNNNGRNPLHCMIEENSDVSIIKHIFKEIKNDKVEELLIAVDNFGNTILHTACEYMNQKFLSRYSNRKFRSDILDLQENALSTVEFLVSMGFDLQAMNNDGETPLDIAKRCKESNNDIVKYLEDALNKQHPKAQPTAITPLLHMMQERRYVAPPPSLVTRPIRRAMPKLF